MKNNSNTNRSEFIKTILLQKIKCLIFFPTDLKELLFQEQPLPYDYRALEPSIDAMTMEIHYAKHAATYAKNLAEACAAEKCKYTISET